MGRATWKRDDWPASEDGFACLIASRAANTSSYSRMQALEAAASAKGLGNLGLLFSDHFTPSLDAGYFVLYSGPFSSYAGASSACRGAHEHGYGGANVRQITT